MCQDDDDDDDDNDDDDGDGAGADDDACGGCGGDHMLGLFTTPDLRLTSTFEYPFLNPNQVGNMSIKVGKSSASSHNILSVTSSRAQHPGQGVDRQHHYAHGGNLRVENADGLIVSRRRGTQLFPNASNVYSISSFSSSSSSSSTSNEKELHYHPFGIDFACVPVFHCVP